MSAGQSVVTLCKVEAGQQAFAVLVVEHGSGDEVWVAEAPLSRWTASVVLDRFLPSVCVGGQDGYERAASTLLYCMKWGMHSREEGCTCDWPAVMRTCRECVCLFAQGKRGFKIVETTKHAIITGSVAAPGCGLCVGVDAAPEKGN